MSVLSRRLRSRFIVTLKSGAMFDGLLYEQDRKTWILRNVTALQEAGRVLSPAVPVDGELVVLVADIAFAQRP